ncbi:hypothetical protein [Cellulomonas pakistanensis]|uniref:Uncharacterized protein n=1 Tax=Cellulomonas pakistanensis TaxID=992287 RepID=A0A919PD77_9CELL|nr:hypothetical protein [Cellulomonas pakistanensis]GIG36442.1 hypothetical protein Cpa01nite_18230 [Cellulomonas pakistanensis]
MPDRPPSGTLSFRRLDPEGAGQPAGTWDRAARTLVPVRTTWRRRPARAGRGSTVSLHSTEHGVDLMLSRSARSTVRVPVVDLRTASCQPSGLLRALADDLDAGGTRGEREVVDALRAQARFLEYDDHELAASPIGLRSGDPSRWWDLFGLLP